MEMESKIRQQIDTLLIIHRELDEKIHVCKAEFEKMSLKKQKLKLKDQIASLQAMLYPDLIA
jgi:hypothetical protein